MATLKRVADWIGVRPGLVLAFLSGAVALRLAMWGLVNFRVEVGDSRSYLHAARNLVEFHVFSDLAGSPPQPTGYRPPLYPAVIAATSVLTGEYFFGLRVFQLLVSLTSVVLTARLARQLAPGTQTLAMALMAFSPFEAVYAGAHLSECLCTALLLAAMLRLHASVSPGQVFGAGVLFGATVLTRDVYLPLAALAGIVWLFTRARELGWRGLGLGLAALFAGVMVIVGPWMIRNEVSTGRGSVSSGRLGYSLWLASWATSAEWSLTDATGADRVYPAEAFRSDREREEINAALKDEDRDRGDKVLRAVAIDRWRSAPLATFLLCLSKAPKLWFGTRFDIFELDDRILPRGSRGWVAVKSLFWGINGATLLLCLAGVWLALTRHRLALWGVLPIVFTIGIYFALNTLENRYSKPTEPFYVVLASLGLRSMIALARRDKGMTA